MFILYCRVNWCLEKMFVGYCLLTIKSPFLYCPQNYYINITSPIAIFFFTLLRRIQPTTIS